MTEQIIHTGSDGTHVTVWRRPDGSKVATIDERTSRRDRDVAGLSNAKWVGCWAADDRGDAHLPAMAIDLIVG